MMGLDLYREVSTGVYSKYRGDDDVDGSLITSTHDGVLGETVIKKLFLRSDTTIEWYGDVSVACVSTISPSEVDGVSSGHGMKLIAGNDQPTEGEWDATDYGNTLSLDDFGSTSGGDMSTYLPFWVRIECPPGAKADNKENTLLRVYYSAYAI